ncbi:MAG: GNAT family N-acetyltransferase [Armatimonadaceae bacterium]
MTEPTGDEWKQGEFTISTDPARVDVDVVHRWLSEESYWAQDCSRDSVERSIAGSLTFGIYHDPTGAMVGFARIITDGATFSYLTDVFVLPEWRGQGLSKWLMETIWTHPDLQGQRRWLLATADAHTLYAQFGFALVEQPDRWMERKPGNWQRSNV